MKARRPFMYTAVSALLCGSLAAGGVYAAVMVTPEPLAAGYDESTDPANTCTLPVTTTWYEGGSEGSFTEETTQQQPAGDSEEKTITTIVTTTNTDEGPPSAAVVNASGQCGTKAKYSYEGTFGTLRITGVGRIESPDQWSGASNFDLSKVQRIEIGSGIDEICAGVFAGCANLYIVELPETLEKIGVGAFKDCAMLMDVEIPDSVTTIGKNAFYGCTNLTCVALPKKLQLIDTGLFRNCSMLDEIQLPETVKCVNEYAFSGCRSLTELRIPDSVNKICSNAFQGCSSLSKLTLPYNLRSTGDGLFTGCTSLKELTVLNPDSQFSEESKMTGCVLRGYNSSTAQSFAAEKGLVFESLGDIPVPYPTLGDYNGDGSADIIDAQQVLIYYVEEEPYVLSRADFRAADTDGNGTITALDAQYIMRYYLLNDLMEQPTQWTQIIRVEE